jgi:MFS family permease
VAVSTANLADGMYLAAGPVLAASLTRDPLLVAGVVVVQRAAVVASVPFAGLAADRMDRRRLLRLGNGGRAVVFAVLAVAVGLGLGSPGALVAVYAAAAFLGTAEAFADTAALVLPPHVVDIERLSSANGQVQAWTSVGQELVGPSIGGSLFVLATWSPFAATAAAFAIASVAAGRLSGDFRPGGQSHSRPTARRVAQDLGVGWRTFWSQPVLRVAALSAAAANALATGVMAVLVLIVTVDLGYSSEVYGFLLVALAVGALTAGSLSGVLSRALTPALAVAAGAGTSAAGFAVLAVAANAGEVAAALFFVSFGVTVSNVTIFTLRQLLVPRDLQGRVTASYRLLALSGMPVGAAIGGLLARHDHSIPAWLAAAGFTVIGTVLVSALRGASIRGGAEPVRLGARVMTLAPVVVPPLPSRHQGRSLPAARPLGFVTSDALGRRASWPAL